MTAKGVGRIGLMGLIGFVLCSCATTFHAPSNAKLEASTKRLANAVVKATNTAERARAHVEAAQKAADKEATASATVLTQVNDLVKLLPPELKAKGEALKKAVDEDQVAIGEIVTNVDAARTDHVQLKKDLDEADAAKMQVDVDKQEYYGNADKLAAIATAKDKKLTWYEWHWWGSWIALGAGVLACIIFAIVRWGAKWSSKAARAAAKIESGGVV